MLSFDTAGLQTGNEIFLAADEDDEHGQQTCHGHGEDVAPLRKLVLAEKPEMAIGSVRFCVSFRTVSAHGNSSHAVRKLKMLTDAMAGLASGQMTLKTR